MRKKVLRMSLGGAQPKASLRIIQGAFKIVGEGGTYLLKPSTETHPFISENEHFCMNVARELGLPVAECCLIVLQNGEYAFLTKRFDRVKRSKIHIEDFASVLNRPAGEKYSGSYLNVVRASQQYCRDSGLERIYIFKQLVLSFLLGNNDLHLKNFSLIDRTTHYEMSPIYDLVCSLRYYPDSSDLALELESDFLGSLTTLGFYTAEDFLYFAKKAGIRHDLAAQFIDEIIAFIPKIQNLLSNSFLPEEEQVLIAGIIEEQRNKLSQGLV
ncbi:HipA domain-containing protein [bacterium]|nr:HipA domain-containing protein [bacterium]